MKQPEEIRIEYVPLSKVEKWPRNPKLHDTEQLSASVERFGFVQPILLDEKTNRLVAGHGRLETLRKMKDSGKQPPPRIKVSNGDWLVPVVRGVSFKNEKEAEAYLVADNRQVELGGWDEESLAELLRGQEIDLTGVGWSSKEIDDLVKQPTVEIGVPQTERRVYETTDIKQIVLYFDSAGFEDVIMRLNRLMTERKITSHTQAFMLLLEDYENNHGA
jgi:ParB-like chromosome segregation protein Spo0J